MSIRRKIYISTFLLKGGNGVRIPALGLPKDLLDSKFIIQGRKPLFGVPPYGCRPKRPVRRIALRASALQMPPFRFTPLTVWLLRLGVGVSSRPYHPQTQGKDERFHRTLAVELLHGRHRACGEQRYYIAVVTDDLGSSPRVRGTARLGRSLPGILRSIPARAGNRST